MHNGRQLSAVPVPLAGPPASTKRRRYRSGWAR